MIKLGFFVCGHKTGRRRGRLSFCALGAVKILVSGLCVIALQGCRADIAEMEKKVLERDPSFREVIDARESMTRELEKARMEYNEKKRRLEGKIFSLRQELQRSRGEHADRVERIKRRFDPDITALENEIRGMRRRLSVRNAEIRALDKSIREIKDLVERGRNLEMTQEEMRLWNERMTSLVREREEAIRERDAISEDIETSGLKVRIMKGR